MGAVLLAIIMGSHSQCPCRVIQTYLTHTIVLSGRGFD